MDLRTAVINAAKSFMPIPFRYLADKLTPEEIDKFLNQLNAAGVYAVKSGDADRAGIVPLAASDDIGATNAA